jgi:hypothetical protein
VEEDFLSRDGRPFFSVGTNYFSTEDNGWDFSGPRNAWVWEKDFAEMEQSGVTFVRTGVWMPKVLFTPLPIELNDDLRVIGDVYRYALKDANVIPAYSTQWKNLKS